MGGGGGCFSSINCRLSIIMSPIEKIILKLPGPLLFAIIQSVLLSYTASKVFLFS